ncbi:MAG: ATP-binding domain-containing protein, partial [Gammaproteobacteria bacterium]|jgi:ATP-dependent exoDNAse (exonuclease V) beta subunit|nr:ATP-binding domain-containing protein [Gammaproteobacteria bacterium]
LLEEGHKIGNLSLSWESKGNQYIQCSTVHSYKGLESPIVIFVELGSAHKQTHSELLYIGMSRARNHLIVIASEEEKQNLDSLGAN